MFYAVLCTLITTLYVSETINIVTNTNRVFEIDYEHDQFLKDGEPFRYISGSLHYFRVPREYWKDRLRKYRAAGLNTICTYIEWSTHEPTPGVYDFEGQNDLEYFIRLAQKEGLLVILRPGPYICAERDLGGYPPWLLHENPNMQLRTSDPSHIKYVNSWLSVLFPKIQPLLYGNGGPVIMVQVENEYGSYIVCDRNYTLWLRDEFRNYVGDKAVLFTTDGQYRQYLKCGPIPGVFITVDFGAVKNATKSFGPLRQVQSHGPLVNSEFYPGWLTHWGDPKEGTVATDKILNTTRQLLSMNASFNFYVFHGGSNYGFSSGANNPPYRPQLTSYDYDAPISESGNLTEKYYAIRSLISEFAPVKNIPFQSTTTVDYGTLVLEPKISLFDSDTGILYPNSTYPQTFEALNQYSGFIMYETVLPTEYMGRGYLQAMGVHDRAIVYVNKEPAGILSRSKDIYDLFISGQAGQTLGLLVENEGHVNYGNITDFKGLISNVTLEGDILTNWKQTGYPMKNISHILKLPTTNNTRLPAFYAGNFHVFQAQKTPQDTFVDMTGWGKGFLYINEFNLGRYWSTEGPQMTLYLPGTLFRDKNVILVMELERPHPNRTVTFVADPIFRTSSNTTSAINWDDISVQMLPKN